MLAAATGTCVNSARISGNGFSGVPRYCAALARHLLAVLTEANCRIKQALHQTLTFQDKVKFSGG